MKIAEVYPIQRLPRRFSAFEYLVPDGINVERGFFVSIPLRNQKVLGVVKQLHERFSPRPGLKEIFGRLTIPPLTEIEIKIFEWLAKDLAQSIPSIINAAIPTSAKRALAPTNAISLPLKIRTSDTPSIQRAINNIEAHKTAFISLTDLPRMAALVLAYAHTHPEGQIAVLVPGIREAEALAPYLSAGGLSLVTGGESEGRRFAAWSDFRQGKTRFLLGTRVASLLLSNSVQTIFVLRSGHESHKQGDHNPRYDTRDLVHEFQKQNNCRLYFLDTTPRVDDFIFFGSENILIEHPEPRPYLVNLNEERPMSGHPLISWTLDGAINDCLKNNRRVLCFYNRKGKASSLRCAECGQGFPCPICKGVFTVYETCIRCHHCGRTEPVPLVCPNCKGVRLIEKGFGNQTVKLALQKQFPEARVSLIDQAIQEDDTAEILLVTSYYLETHRQFFARNNFGLIVNLDSDLPLLDPNFRSFENAIRLMEDLRGLAIREQALFVAQTRSPEIFSAYYDDPDICLKKELELRRSYEVPPFVRWVRLKIRDEEKLRAELELKAIVETLKPLAGITVFPLECNEQGCSVSISVQPEAVDKLLAKLSELPDRVVIDTNAIS